MDADHINKSNNEINYDEWPQQSESLTRSQARKVRSAISWKCPICGDSASFRSRMAHMNQCIDSGKYNTARFVSEIDLAWRCPVCEEHVDLPWHNCNDVDMERRRVLHRRLRHLKGCARLLGVRPSELRERLGLAQHEQEYLENSDEHVKEPSNYGVEALCEVVVPISDQPLVSSAPAPAVTATPTVESKISAFSLMMNAAKKPKPVVTTAVPNSGKGKRKFFRQGKRTITSLYQIPSYKIIPGTKQPPIIVDGFQYVSPQVSDVYVLTHFHSDHYGPLTGKNFESYGNAGCIIYCSEVTGKLVSLKLGLKVNYLRPLKLNTWHRMADGQGQALAVDVCLLDANHCPGAAMFLFRHRHTKKTTLHVGDFRWNRNMLSSIQSALKAMEESITVNGNIHLDYLFLDTTYCGVDHQFPPQQVVIDEVYQFIQKFLNTEVSNGKENSFFGVRKKKLLVLFGSYSIGKEKLYMEVASRLQLQVRVDSGRLRMLQCLGWPENVVKKLTTDRTLTPLWVVPLGHLSFETMEKYMVNGNQDSGPKCGPFDAVLGIKPTGWTFTKKHTSSTCLSVRRKGKLVVVGAPYSEHSSFDELRDCVQCLHAKRIVPTVNCHSESSVKGQLELLLSQANRE